MDNYKEIEYKGHTIKIVYDENYDSPDSWGDENLFLVGYHRDFWVDRAKRTKEGKREGGISEGLAQSIFNNGKYEDGSINDEAKNYLKKYHIFPLSAYIHSGVRLYLGTHKVCQWDSCQVGLVFASKSERKTRKKALKCVEGLIKTWNQYLSGEICGFQIEDESGEQIDSCYGFYGDEGIEQAISYAKSNIDYVEKEYKENLKATKELVFG